MIADPPRRTSLLIYDFHLLFISHLPHLHTSTFLIIPRSDAPSSRTDRFYFHISTFFTFSPFPHLYYSVRNDFTGLATAALTDS